MRPREQVAEAEGCMPKIELLNQGHRTMIEVRVSGHVALVTVSFDKHCPLLQKISELALPLGTWNIAAYRGLTVSAPTYQQPRSAKDRVLMPRQFPRRVKRIRDIVSSRR